MSRDNGNNNYPYPLTRINTLFLSPDQNYYFPNQEKNILASRTPAYFSSAITNDDSTSSCCSISEPASSDQPCLGVEDHTSDIASDHDIRSPDSPTTPTNQFGVNNVVNISSYPWSLSTIYEISPSPIPQKIFHTPLLYNQKSDLQQQQQQQQTQQLQQQQEQQKQIQHESEIISPIQTSPSLSTSSCMDYLEENDKEEEEEEEVENDNACDDNTSEESPKKGYQKKSKEEIFLKFRLPVNGIATRTRSKKSIPNQDPPSTKKKHHHLSEEEKVLQKYSYKVASIPPYSRKVTLPSQNTSILSQKNSNYPIPKTRQQILTNWTNRDQKKFLSTYLSEGKNFNNLAKTLNKPTKEIVEFYYYFKMSKEFRTAKTMKKDIIGYSSKLEQINESITKLKHLSEKTISSPNTKVSTRVTFAPSAINKKRRGRPKKGSHVRGGGIQYYY